MNLRGKKFPNKCIVMGISERSVSAVFFCRGLQGLFAFCEMFSCFSEHCQECWYSAEVKKTQMQAVGASIQARAC